MLRKSDDPYGSYNPPAGYYSGESTLYPPLTEDDRLHPKTVVIGARSTDGALAVQKETLRARQLVEVTIGGISYAVIYDQRLDTGYVYRNTAGHQLVADGETVRVDSEQYAPASLPFERIDCYDSMWFAWAGFYPNTVLIE